MTLRARSTLFRHHWISYFAVGLLATLGYAVTNSAVLQAAIAIGVSASAAAALLAGVHLLRPADRTTPLLLAGSQLVFAIGWIFWQESILSTGVPPASFSLADGFLLVTYPLIAVALLRMATRSRAARDTLGEVGIIAVAAATLSWVVLIQPFLTDDALPLAVRVTQTGYALGDVLVLAALAQLMLAAGPRIRKIPLLVLGVASLLAADASWNWFALAGNYSAGGLSDVGWILFSVFFGAAGLRHAAAAPAGSVQTSKRVPRSYLVILGLAAVSSSLVSGSEIILGPDADTVATTLGTGLLSLLVVMRLVAFVRQGERLQDELAQRNDRLEEAERVTGLGNWTWEVRTGALWWSPGVYRIFGLDPAQAPTFEAFLERVHPDDRDRVLATIQAPRTHAESFQFEFRFIRPDGSQGYMETNARAETDESGATVRMLGTGHDVTERKILEAERERLLAAEREGRLALAVQNERLLALDRMKDGFVASVSHELRTPLTSIRGYLELVLEEEAGPLSDEQRHFLSIVERNSERLLRLVGDLLFVAQVDAGKIALDLGEVDVRELAESAVQTARPLAAEKDIELILSTESLPTLWGDASRLAQLLDNLVSNALKYTPRGGQVELRTFAPDGSVVIEVADTGMGISGEDQEHLFERFFRTDSANSGAIPGTGLGLSIAKAIVEGHGGTIGVESEGGAGTTFRVELPLVPDGELAQVEREKLDVA